WTSRRDAGMGGALKLPHVQMGSQIPSGRDTARGMREATRYFVELTRLGADIDYVDVGGGLGIDYEGTRSRSYNSVNYGVAQYASTIVQALAQACAEAGLRQPRIDRKSTRLNSSHVKISYAVFCLKKKSGSRRPVEDVHTRT